MTCSDSLLPQFHPVAHSSHVAVHYLAYVGLTTRMPVASVAALPTAGVAPAAGVPIQIDCIHLLIHTDAIVAFAAAAVAAAAAAAAAAFDNAVALHCVAAFPLAASVLAASAVLSQSRVGAASPCVVAH